MDVLRGKGPCFICGEKSPYQGSLGGYSCNKHLKDAMIEAMFDNLEISEWRKENYGVR